MTYHSSLSNEFQRRGQHLVYVYLPEVTTDGIRGRAWVSQAIDEAGARRVESELKELASAIVRETKLAAGVEFDLEKDVRFEVTVQDSRKPRIFEENRLKR